MMFFEAVFRNRIACVQHDALPLPVQVGTSERTPLALVGGDGVNLQQGFPQYRVAPPQPDRPRQ